MKVQKDEMNKNSASLIRNETRGSWLLQMTSFWGNARKLTTPILLYLSADDCGRLLWRWQEQGDKNSKSQGRSTFTVNRCLQTCTNNCGQWGRMFTKSRTKITVFVFLWLSWNASSPIHTFMEIYLVSMLIKKLWIFIFRHWKYTAGPPSQICIALIYIHNCQGIMNNRTLFSLVPKYTGIKVNSKQIKIIQGCFRRQHLY
jgi:hypothetical protein